MVHRTYRHSNPPVDDWNANDWLRFVQYFIHHGLTDHQVNATYNKGSYSIFVDYWLLFRLQPPFPLVAPHLDRNLVYVPPYWPLKGNLKYLLKVSLLQHNPETLHSPSLHPVLSQASLDLCAPYQFSPRVSHVNNYISLKFSSCVECHWLWHLFGWDSSHFCWILQKTTFYVKNWDIRLSRSP